MSYLSREEILEAKDYKTGEIETPEWGGQTLVRSLSAFHVKKLGIMGESGVDTEKSLDAMLDMVVWSVIDKDGERVFTEKDKDALKDKDFDVIKRIAEAAMELSGLTKEEEEPKNP